MSEESPESPVCTYFVRLWLDGDEYRAAIQEETASGKKLPPHLAGETLLNAADALRKAAEKHYPEVVGEWTGGEGEMSGLCKDCKWWHEGQYEDVSPEPGYGVCDLVSNAWFLPPSTRAAVRPQQYGSVLTVAEDFGCNQFEPEGQAAP